MTVYFDTEQLTDLSLNANQLIGLIRDLRDEVPEGIRSLLAMRVANALHITALEGEEYTTAREFQKNIRAFILECELTDDIPRVPVDIETDLSKVVAKWSRLDAYYENGEWKGLTPAMRALVANMVTDLLGICDNRRDNGN